MRYFPVFELNSSPHTWWNLTAATLSSLQTRIVEPGVYLVRVPFEDYQDVWYSPARLFPAELFARNTQQIQQFDYHRTLPSWELTDEDRELLTLLEESRFEITYPVDSPFKVTTVPQSYMNLHLANTYGVCQLLDVTASDSKTSGPSRKQTLEGRHGR